MPKKIMIIEDDADILDIMTYILTNEGYEVNSDTGSTILSKVTADYPDLILLDNRLPEGLGLEICKRYKLEWKDRGLSVCPLIMISADHELGTRIDQYHADGFIEKPFDIGHFVAMVNKFIKDQ